MNISNTASITLIILICSDITSCLLTVIGAGDGLLVQIPHFDPVKETEREREIECPEIMTRLSQTHSAAADLQSTLQLTAKRPPALTLTPVTTSSCSRRVKRLISSRSSSASSHSSTEPDHNTDMYERIPRDRIKNLQIPRYTIKNHQKYHGIRSKTIIETQKPTNTTGHDQKPS